MKNISKMEELVKNYQAMRAMVAEAKAEQDAIAGQIKQLMDEEGLEEYKSSTANVIYREQVRRTIDSKALRAELPEIAERYTNETTARPLRIA